MAKALHAFPSLSYSNEFGFPIPDYMILDGNSNACSVSDYDPSDEDRLQAKSLEAVEGTTSLISTSRTNSVAKQEVEMDTSFPSSILSPAAVHPHYTMGPDSLNFSIDGATFVSSSTFHAAHSAIEGNQLVRQPKFMMPMLNPLSRTKETDLKSQQHLGTSPRWGNSTFRTRCTQEKALGVQHKWTGKRALAQRESHIWSERERRKGMNRLFCILRSLLPEPISKTDKSTVVSEIIKHISILQKDIEELSSKQASLLNRASKTSQSSSADSAASTIIRGTDTPSSRTMQSSTSIVAPAVALHVSNSNVFLNISCTRRPSLFANILRVMRQHQLRILNATVSTEDTNIGYCIHSKAMDITHFARESLHSALLAITKPID